LGAGWGYSQCGKNDGGDIDDGRQPNADAMVERVTICLMKKRFRHLKRFVCAYE
jgi:hypothetical protein